MFPAVGSGESWGDRLRTPVVEGEDDTFRDIELQSGAALDGLGTWRNLACDTHGVGPDLPVHPDGATTAATVICNDEVRLAVFRRLNATPKMRVSAGGERRHKQNAEEDWWDRDSHS